jgi:IS1 family transposase
VVLGSVQTILVISHHYPEECIICTNKLEKPVSPHTGFYTYELERKPNGIEITCTLHYYYGCICECGHENIEEPGEGYESVLEGRKRNVKLSEYTIVGPMLATFIASLNRNYGMSRKKIQLYLNNWLSFELSVGLICKAIREVGIACYPVVEELIEELQKEDQIHLDETPWYQKGIFCWIWVAISKTTAIYKVGTRKKEELLEIITEAFFGWLITDGYGAYRSYEKRQRCLAHLIRKAVALTGLVSEEAQKAGEWFLRELRGLIAAMAQGEEGKIKCRPILARLKRACNLGKESDHAKLKSLAKEILNDWDAVVAFVKNPELPATNNEAERALRWVVLFRKITFGTRTSEGSRSFASMLSVIETCRLRNVDPWEYIANMVAHARKGEIVSTPSIE